MTPAGCPLGSAFPPAIGPSVPWTRRSSSRGDGTACPFLEAEDAEAASEELLVGSLPSPKPHCWRQAEGQPTGRQALDGIHSFIHFFLGPHSPSCPRRVQGIKSSFVEDSSEPVPQADPVAKKWRPHPGDSGTREPKHKRTETARVGRQGTPTHSLHLGAAQQWDREDAAGWVDKTATGCPDRDPWAHVPAAGS